MWNKEESISSINTRQEKIIISWESSEELEWYAKKARFLLKKGGTGGEGRRVKT